jgi:SAM-dependent methyltransferase
VVAADVAPGMLRHCPRRLHPVAADATELPFADCGFDLAVAAFCLGHLTDIPACLAELRRVCGSIAASAFAPGWTHPAKPAVDEILAAAGFRPPDWYLTFKNQTEPRAADAGHLLRQFADAGFTSGRTRTVVVRTGVARPAELASWRLGMAHVAPWLASLSLPERAEVSHAAEAAVVAAGAPPLDVSMLVLTAS